MTTLKGFDLSYIAQECGFYDQSHFHHQFKAITTVTPGEYQFKLSRPTISHHLNLMKRSKILSSRKEGKEVFYSFNKDIVINNLELLIQYFKQCC